MEIFAANIAISFTFKIREIPCFDRDFFGAIFFSIFPVRGYPDLSKDTLHIGALNGGPKCPCHYF